MSQQEYLESATGRRDELNRQKRDLGSLFATGLSATMQDIYRWQMQDRGLTPHAAYQETIEEVDRLVRDVGEAVKGQVTTLHMAERRSRR